jgi:hypothetical protein
MVVCDVKTHRYLLSKGTRSVLVAFTLGRELVSWLHLHWAVSYVFGFRSK